MASTHRQRYGTSLTGLPTTVILLLSNATTETSEYLAGTFYDAEGNRWYRDPSNPSQTYAGVTSILNIKSMDFLTKAKVKGVAVYAAKNRKSLAEMNQASVTALLKEQDVVLPDWRVATEYGTAIHTVTDNYLKGQPLDQDLQFVEGTDSYPVANTFTEFVPQYWSEFKAKHNVKFVDAEQVVLNDEYGYGGRFDHVLEVDGELVMVDTKSNANGPYGKVALQNSAYGQRSNKIVDLTTGARSPMHAVTGSYVLWIREDGWNLLPLEFTDETFDDFLKHLYLFAYGATGREKHLVGEPIHQDQLKPPVRFFK